MRKFLLICFTFFAYITLNAQSDIRVYNYNKTENTVELDLKKIDNYYERLYLLYSINNDSRFVTTSTDEYGLFYISSADETPDSQNFSEVFEMFFQTKLSDFNSFDKLTIAETEKVWKDGIANFDILSLMMDIMMDGAPRGNNDSCYKAEPFCTDNGLYTFQAVTGNNHPSESGPSYNCLSSQPCPSWYYMKISTPGNFTIHMEGKDGTTQRDIDFCCWGPFNDPIAPCPHIPGPNPNGLTADKVVDCSYSSSYSENCDIPSSAQTGQYYILIITNYSTQRCIITFSKAEGSGPGTTDCSIMPPLIDVNTPCVGGDLTLEAQDISGATYAWTGPNGWTAGNQRVIVRTNATTDMTGLYSCNVTVGSQTSDDMTVMAYVLPTPESDFTANDVCIGETTQFIGTEIVTPATYLDSITSRSWNFGDGDTSDEVNPSHTYAEAGDYTVTYTTSIELHDGYCSDTKTKVVHVYDIPVADAGENQNIYYGTPATLTASNVEGASYAWTPVNMIDGNPNQQTVQTVPLTGVQTFHLTVTSSHGCVDEDEVTVGVGEEMTATVSCDDDEICSNSETTVSVSASGGSHNYSYNWTSIPESVIDNPTSLSTTVHPHTTTVYNCTISDGTTTLNLNVTVIVHPVLTTDLGDATICEQMLPYELDLPDGSKAYIFEEHTPDNPWDTLVYTEFGCENHVSFVLTLSDITSYTRNVETCNEDYIWIDDLTGTGEVYHFTESGSHTKIFETVPCWTQVTVNFTRHPEYTDPYSYPSGVFDAGESCDPYKWQYVDPITGKILGDGNTYTESMSKDINFNSIHGCDSVVHFTFTRHYDVTVDDSEAVAIDTCMNSDGVYIWGGKECRQGDIVFGDIWSSTPDYFSTVQGCDSIAKIRLRLFDRPYVDNQIDGIKRVEMGDGLLPSIYNYTVTGLSGAGIDSLYPPTYKWELLTYYETPNNINGECSWTLASSTTSNVAQVFVDNIPGNALLKCTISTLCGNVTSSLFLYTNGYEQGESVDEIDYDKFIEIYPNPATNEIYIGHANEIINSQLSINIYNFSGQLVDTFLSDTQNNVTTYSSSNLSNGVYFIKISGKDFNVMRKVVVSR